MTYRTEEIRHVMRWRPHEITEAIIAINDGIFHEVIDGIIGLNSLSWRDHRSLPGED